MSLKRGYCPAEVANIIINNLHTKFIEAKKPMPDKILCSVLSKLFKCPPNRYHLGSAFIISCFLMTSFAIAVVVSTFDKEPLTSKQAFEKFAAIFLCALFGQCLAAGCSVSLLLILIGHCSEVSRMNAEQTKIAYMLSSRGFFNFDTEKLSDNTKYKLEEITRNFS